MPVVATEEETEKRRRAKPTPPAMESDGADEVAVMADEAEGEEGLLNTQSARRARPIVLVKVVYLGGDPNRSQPIKGRIMAERIGDTVKKNVADSGISSYDFSLFNSLGEPITAMTMATDHKIVSVRGRRFAWVEHPDHIYAFANMRHPESKRPEFQIVATPDKLRLLDTYFMYKNRGKKKLDQDYEDISASA